MKSLLLGLAALSLLGGCRAPAGGAWSGELQRWGTLREALRDGQTQARVALAEVARADVYAIGALAELAGEVTVVDGEVWVTRGDPARPVTTRGTTSDARATVLFAFEVERWREIVVAERVDPSELDAFVAAQARAAGLDLARPFPFLVEGELAELALHVVNGECHMRARMLGTEASADPYRLHAHTAQGRLVGIHSTGAPGVVCHMGANTHVHAVLEGGGGLTGHVESVGLARGARLFLPGG